MNFNDKRDNFTVKDSRKQLDIDKTEFQQNVQDCLSNGKFALLIVGDRIYPEVTQLAEMIQSAPDMQYKLGFVELLCYKLDSQTDWPLIIVPHFVTKTNEITRAIVKVIYEEKKPEIEIDTPPVGEKASVGHTTFSEFIASLPSNISEIFKNSIENWMKAGYTIYWGQLGCSLRVNYKGKPATIFEAYPWNATVIQVKRVEKYNLPMELYEAYKEQLMKSQVFRDAFAAGKGHIKYIRYDNMSRDDVSLLLETTDKLARAISSASKSLS